MNFRQYIREQITFMMMEGGHVPGVNSTVPKEYLDSTISTGFVLANLKGLPYSIVGNKNKPFLGDVDTATEYKDIAKAIKFSGNDPAEFWSTLDSHLKKSKVNGYKVVRGLKQFHLVIPLVDKKGKQLKAVDKNGNESNEDGAVQIDVFIGNLEWMAKAMSGATNSKYKAVYRNLFLVDLLSQLIFKTKDPDIKRKMQIDWKEGVSVVSFVTDDKGKRKKIKVKKLTGDIDKFAKFLFGKDASFKDIDTFEKLYKMFRSKKYHFPKIRRDVISAYKKTLKKHKLDLPKEIK